MRRLILWFLCLCLFSSAAFAGSLKHASATHNVKGNSGVAESTISGKPYVLDGDTIVLKKKRIRFYGIDAPELHQMCWDHDGKEWACGKVAKSFLLSLILEKGHLVAITCHVKDKDRYKRLISVCYRGKTDLNAMMVSKGYAIAYTYFSKDYVSEEATARQNHLGIWNGAFEEPYLWRKQHK